MPRFEGWKPATLQMMAGREARSVARGATESALALPQSRYLAWFFFLNLPSLHVLWKNSGVR